MACPPSSNSFTLYAGIPTHVPRSSWRLVKIPLSSSEDRAPPIRSGPYLCKIQRRTSIIALNLLKSVFLPDLFFLYNIQMQQSEKTMDVLIKILMTIFDRFPFVESIDCLFPFVFVVRNSFASPIVEDGLAQRG